MIKKLSALFLFVFSGFSQAADIALAWDKPLLREDGAQIEIIDHFNLYVTIDNISQEIIRIPAGLSEFSFSDVVAGNYLFQISTVENGLEGDLSSPVSVNIPAASQSKPIRIELTVKVVE